MPCPHVWDMWPLRQGRLLQPKPGRAREGRKNVSFSFPLHNAVIDLMPIDTNAQSLGKRQIKPQNRHQSELKPLLSTSLKTQITSKVLRWQEKVLKNKKILNTLSENWLRLGFYPKTLYQEVLQVTNCMRIHFSFLSLA